MAGRVACHAGSIRLFAGATQARPAFDTSTAGYRTGRWRERPDLDVISPALRIDANIACRRTTADMLQGESADRKRCESRIDDRVPSADPDDLADVATAAVDRQEAP